MGFKKRFGRSKFSVFSLYISSVWLWNFLEGNPKATYRNENDLGTLSKRIYVKTEYLWVHIKIFQYLFIVPKQLEDNPTICL